MTIDNKYTFGDIVYLTTDTEQIPRVITNLEISPNNTIVYVMYAGSSCSRHYDFELSSDIDYSLKTSH